MHDVIWFHDHIIMLLGGNFGALEESSYSDRQTIEYLKTPTLSLSIGNAAVFVTVKATVTCVRRFDDSWYFACPQPNCGRKVKKGDRSSMYYCAKCDKSCEEVYDVSLLTLKLLLLDSVNCATFFMWDSRTTQEVWIFRCTMRRYLTHLNVGLFE